MDPATLIQIGIAVVSLLVGHFHLLPFLPPPAPKPSPFPNTFGHGELLRYIEQAVANALARAGTGVPPAPVGPTPAPTPGGLDINALLQQILDYLKAQKAAAQNATPHSILPPRV